MTDELLDKQIAAEAREIENAPAAKIETGVHGRCHFCGRISDNLIEVRTIPDHPIRYKGAECCGGGK
jgi:hypothetical protein